MITLATDKNNDLFLSTSGNIEVYSELTALAQTCEQSVKTILGELVFQGDVGTPAFQFIWSGSPNVAQAENAIREIILGVDGVESVEFLSADIVNNSFQYSAIIKTIYGETQIGL